MLLVGAILAVLDAITTLALLQTLFAIVAAEVGQAALDRDASHAVEGITVGFIGAIGTILMPIASMSHGEALARGAATELTVQCLGATAIAGIAIDKAGGTEAGAVKVSGTHTDM